MGRGGTIPARLLPPKAVLSAGRSPPEFYAGGSAVPGLAGSLGLEGVWPAMSAELCARELIFMIRLYRARGLNIDLFQMKKSQKALYNPPLLC